MLHRSGRFLAKMGPSLRCCRSSGFLSLTSCFYSLLLLGSISSYVGQARAFWIVRHKSLSTDRLDPIVQPGVVSSHVHTIVGAKNFGPTVDNETLLASECTTAPVQADMSSYWAPQLYYRSENESLTLIPIQAVNTYCKFKSY